MTLAQLLVNTDLLDGAAFLNHDVVGIAADSRHVTPGAAFFAVRGAAQDGAQFIPAAILAGATAIVSETPRPPGLDHIPWLRVRDSRDAIARAACAWHGHPSRHLRVYGVTGTNGKTTTAGLVHLLLENAGVKAGLISTVVTGCGSDFHDSANTTPGPVELQHAFRQMADAHCAAVAMEVSSHAADQRRIDGTRFHVAAFTHLTQDHLDYHGDMENYFVAKRRFFQSAAEENPACTAVINADDPYGQRLLQDPGLATLTFGFGSACDVRAENIKLRTRGTTYTLATPWGRADIESQLAGRFNIANMLCAAAMVLVGNGANFDAVVRGTTQALPRWGRLERVATAAPFQIFVDYAHTPDALENVLATLREITRGKLVVVFGCGGDRDRTKRPLMGGVAARLADTVLLTSDNPRSEDPQKILDDIRAGIPSGCDLTIEPDRREAIRQALLRCEGNDILLVAGKGHERGQTIGGTILPFDDRDVVREEAAALFGTKRHP